MYLGERCPTPLLACSIFLIIVFETAAGSRLRGEIFHLDKTFDDLLPVEVTQWSAAHNVLHCGRWCESKLWCNSFFYNEDAGFCALERRVYVSLWSNQTISAPGWRYYRIASAQCPVQSDYVIDRLTATCYRMVTSPPLTWLDARAACNSSGEMLVVLQPLVKADFVMDFLNTHSAVRELVANFHIGAMRPGADWDTPVYPQGPSFEWFNGTLWNRADWNVVMLKQSGDFTWVPAKETYSRKYICERPFLRGRSGL